MRTLITCTLVSIITGCSDPYYDNARPHLWYYTGIDSTNAKLVKEIVDKNQSFIVLELTEEEMHKLRRNIGFVSADSFLRILDDHSVYLAHEFFDLMNPDPKCIYFLKWNPDDIYGYYFLELDTNENKLKFGESFPEWM